MPRKPAAACPAANRVGTAGKDLSWEPLRIELVVEVAYEHMQGDRFRHLAHFRRWRPDKPPKACTYAATRSRSTPGTDEHLLRTNLA